MAVITKINAIDAIIADYLHLDIPTAQRVRLCMEVDYDIDWSECTDNQWKGLALKANLDVKNGWVLA